MKILHNRVREGMVLEIADVEFYVCDVEYRHDCTIIEGNYSGLDGYAGSTMIFYDDEKVEVIEG